MSAILVDTNVLLDVVTDDATWAGWSQRQLEIWALRGTLVINAVIYAELSIGFERIEELEAVLTETGIALAEIPRPALFLAGKVFRAYKRKGGARPSATSHPTSNMMLAPTSAVLPRTSAPPRQRRRR